MICGERQIEDDPWPFMSVGHEAIVTLIQKTRMRDTAASLLQPRLFHRKRIIVHDRGSQEH